jgi:hypothetical protein
MPDEPEQAAQWRDAGLGVALATGRQELIRSQQPDVASISVRLERACEALRRDHCAILDEQGGRVFLQPFNPPLRLMLVGAVHTSHRRCRAWRRRPATR